MVYEHKGYVLQQSDYNNHYMIFEKESGQRVMHCQCGKKLTEQEAKEAIEFYLDLIKGD